MTAVMPRELTADTVLTMAEADEFHRYELTPDGVLIVSPPPNTDHDEIVMRLASWLIGHGVDPALVKVNSGVAVGAGYRVPDLMLLHTRVARSRVVDPATVRLTVEVVSRSSRLEDTTEKPVEYGAAGIAHFWLVEPDSRDVLASRVTRRSGLHDGRYTTTAEIGPLAHLLTLTPPGLGLTS